MSFSAEINDFVKGFQAGAAVGGDIQDRKMRREKDKLDQQWKEKDFDFEKEKFGYLQSSDKEKGARANRALDIQESSAAEARRERAEARADANKRHAESTKLGYARIEASKKSGYSDGADLGDDESTDYDDSAGYEGDDLDSLVAEGNGETGEEVEEYAQGGPVGEESEEDKPEAVAQAIPTAPPKPKLRPETEAAPEKDPTVNRQGKGDAKVLFEDVKPIVKMVLDDTKAELSAKPEAIQTDPKKSQDRVNVATGEGAMSNDEIKQIDKVIDPENKMAPHELKAKRLVTAYNHFAEKGETEKAARVAKGIIAHNKIASQTLGKLAQVALEKGDLTSASKLISDAYNEVPDGKSIEAQPTQKGTILYKVNYDNRALMQGELAPQQLWQLAGGVANGTEFIKRMGEIAATAPADTAESKPKKGKNFVYYDDALSAAADSTRSYLDLKRQHEALLRSKDQDAAKEDIADIEEQMAVAKKAAAAAQQKLKAVGSRTKRPRKLVEEELTKAIANSVGAIPEEAPAPPEEAEAGSEEAPLQTGSALGNLANTYAWTNPIGIAQKAGIAIGKSLYGSPEAEAVPTQQAPATPPSNKPAAPIQVKSKAEYDALPSGASYVAPDGSLRRKP